jgi:uncharacterized membrane protein YfcA
MISDYYGLVFGGLIGVSLGFFGGGGSILAVPILVYIFGENVHSATAISLAIVGSTAVLAAYFHHRKGEVRLETGIYIGVLAIIGTIPGVYLNQRAGGTLILVLFAFLMIIVAVAMLLKKPVRRNTAQAKMSCELYLRKNWLRLLVVSIAIGLLTGFFGVGGGFLIVPALVLEGHLPPHQAVGTSLVVIAIASFAGFVQHLGYGGIDLWLTGLFIVGGIAGVLVGVGMVERVSGRELDRGFSLLMIAVAAYIIARSLIG